jgi:hypothetical protein
VLSRTTRLKKHFKEYYWVGILQLVKPTVLAIIVFYLAKFLSGFALGYEIRFWEMLAGVLPADERIFRMAFALLIIALPYLFATYSLSTLAKPQRRLMAKKFRIFVQGGHKIVMHREFGPETAFRHCVVTSRNMDGAEEMLSLIIIKPAFPEVRPVERKNTRVIDHHLSIVASYIFSLGLNPPNDWGSRPWTDEEYRAKPTDENLLG